MGGHGSGRWGGWTVRSKGLVEQTLTLDINALARAGVVRSDVEHRGSWRWWQGIDEPDPETDKPSSVIGFRVKTGANSGVIHLDYVVKLPNPDEGGEPIRTPMEVAVTLTTTRLPSGGLRWWFICPAKRLDQPFPCRRRVGRLHLPRRSKLFACRHCYDLTYTSCRESRGNMHITRMLSTDTGFPLSAVKRLLIEDDRARDWNRRNPFQDAVITKPER